MAAFTPKKERKNECDGSDKVILQWRMGILYGADNITSGIPVVVSPLSRIHKRISKRSREFLTHIDSDYSGVFLFEYFSQIILLDVLRNSNPRAGITDKR